MSLVDKLIDSVDDIAAEDLRIGKRYTAAKVDGRIGLAYSSGSRKCTEIEARKALLRSKDLCKASVGAAVLNALLPPGEYKKLNVFEHILDIAENYRHRYKKIGVVGRFPFIHELRKINNNVLVFELEPKEGELPATLEDDLLPDCDMVVITGASLVNHTLEKLLRLSEGYTLVIGPTTPLSPLLFDYGAHLIAGVRVMDKRILDIVEKGGGTKDFKTCTEDVIVDLSEL
ncbi:MAG: DUF364 domain-containing protein [Candidatus Thermoplasmatota archaeon]|nr:DUF364 domain-containing protein [Candidatus Thermoplasmatota archaeon]